MIAALCMSALDDREDDPPHHYLRAMPENDEHEVTDTLAPPTDRDATTQTENPKPHRDAVNPPPAHSPSPATADSIFSEAVRQIVEAASDIRAERESRRQFEENQIDLQRQTLAAIERADRNGDANWRATQHQIDTWRNVDNAKNAEQDDRIAALEARIATLEGTVLADLGALKRTVEELKANVAARPAQASPTAT